MSVRSKLEFGAFFFHQFRRRVPKKLEDIKSVAVDFDSVGVGPFWKEWISGTVELLVQAMIFILG